MIATILDTKTGNTQVVDGPRSFEWAFNNWSCDCNRCTPFGDDVIKEMKQQNPEGLCYGCQRFLVINAEMNDEFDDEIALDELNDGYPDKLLQQYKII